MWKEIFYNYFQDEGCKIYSFKIFNKLFAQHTQGQMLRLKEKEIFLDENEFQKLISEFIKEKIKIEEKGKTKNQVYFSTSIFPTLISEKEAKNFYLDLKPAQYPIEEEEIYFWLFHITSSVFYKNYAFNIISSKPDKWSTFLKRFKNKSSKYGLVVDSERGINKDKLKNFLNLKSITLEIENLVVFYVLAFFAKIFLEENEELEELGIDDASVGILVEFKPRQKNKIYFYNKINRFIKNVFYADEEFTTDFIRTIESLITYDKNYKDMSLKFVNNLLYHLLKYQRLNGEMLYKVIDLKIDSLKHQKRIKPFYKIEELISKFT
jgi:hypothetical protein